MAEGLTNPTIVRDADLERAIAALYDARLPYHNFEHALANLETCQKLIDHCIQVGRDVDATTIYLATLLHDAGFQDDEQALGQPSKEAWAAELAERLLRNFNVPEATIQAVRQAILATACGQPCPTLEASIVKAADLAGLAADYPIFVRNAHRLWREQMLLTGQSITWDQWRQRALSVLDLYIEDLAACAARLPAPALANAAITARANCDRLREEPAPTA